MEEIAVRRARPEEALAIARVHVASWRASYRGIVPDAFLDGLSAEGRLPRWQQTLGSTAAGAGVWVAEVAGEIVGLASAGQERSGDRHYRGELYALYLLPAYQRRGLGRRLVGAVAAHLVEQGIQTLVLWVLAANAPGRRFYEALGGVPLREQNFELGGTTVVEVAYGWMDTTPLLIAGAEAAGNAGG